MQEIVLTKESSVTRKGLCKMLSDDLSTVPSGTPVISTDFLKVYTHSFAIDIAIAMPCCVTINMF